MKRISFFLGESGCGKTYLQEYLLNKYPNTYRRIMSTTTREPREGEVNGVSYDFLSKEEFIKLKDNDDLLQWIEFNDKKRRISGASWSIRVW